MQITRLEDILQDTKAVFLDSYGVIKNHNGLIEGMDNTIEVLKKMQIPFKILTNDASRSQLSQLHKFQSLGIDHIREKDIITSGMMAYQYLVNKIGHGKIAYVGTPAAAEAVIQGAYQAVPIDEIETHRSEDIRAIVFLDDEGYDWRTTINHIINFLRTENVPVIIANTDLIYPVNKNNVALATGGIAHLIEMVIRRRFIKFGKPDSPMFSYAYNSLLEEGHKLKPSEILMIGDTLHTDILGGNKFGTKTALVLTGNTTSKNAQLVIDSTGVLPDYIMESAVLV